jgi:hypothetical protein
MFRRFLRLVAAMSVVLVASCGGGGGDPGECVLCGGSDSEVADLRITLSEQSVTNSGSDTITATITAVDSGNVALSGVEVGVAVDSNAVATLDSPTTGESGTVTATLGVGTDKSNRVVTLTATSGSISRSATFQVTGTKITSTYATTVTPGSTGNTIRYLVTDINNTAMVDQPISVSGAGLATVEGTTDNAGYFDYVYEAPATAGSLVITATVAGVSNTATVQVQATGAVDAAVGPVSSASIAASPNKVSTNLAGSQANQSQVRALFVRADNSAIQNVRVRFDLDGDANAVGGSFSSGDSLLYSSANGTVTASYIPGTRSSPTDGVTVRACWDYTDFAAGTCPNEVTTTLTVTSEAISVTLGTNELISEGEAGLTYIKQFVAMVVDSAGNALSGVTVTPVVDLTDYAKGQWGVGAGGWTLDRNGDGVLSSGEFWTCTNEDTDRDGILDSGEDLDDDGILEPRKADVSVRMVGSTTTDSSGLAVLQIEYPKNVASWVRFQVTITAGGVSGTEGRASFVDWLPVPAEAVNDTDNTPAFVVSPYGTTASCAVH